MESPLSSRGERSFTQKADIVNAFRKGLLGDGMGQSAFIYKKRNQRKYIARLPTFATGWIILKSAVVDEWSEITEILRNVVQLLSLVLLVPNRSDYFTSDRITKIAHLNWYKIKKYSRHFCSKSPPSWQIAWVHVLVTVSADQSVYIRAVYYLMLAEKG